MQELIFFKILAFNIIDSNLILNKEKELKLISKIVDLYTKFKYYKLKLLLNNTNILNLFNKSQKTYYLVKLFCNKLKIKYAKIYNSEDLLCNELVNKITFNIYIDKFIYKFTYEDLIKIIKTSLLNFDSEGSIYYITNYFSSPLKIKNPYTNIPFKKYVLYNFYIFCKNHNYKIPTLFQLFYECNFILNDLFLLHENYLTLNSIKNHIIGLNNESKYNYLLKISVIFTEFLTKHFNKIAIKYLCVKFRNKFFNLNLTSIKNNYDEIIYYYLSLLYYYKINNSNNFINYKIKLIMGLLHHKELFFIDERIEYSDLTVKNIVHFLNKKIDIIVLKELNDFNLINNIDIILSYERNNQEIVNNEELNNKENNNEENNNEENNNEENNNQELNNQELNNQENYNQEIIKKKINLKNKFYIICKNSNICKIFYKIIIINILLINCYSNILITKKIYSLFF